MVCSLSYNPRQGIWYLSKQTLILLNIIEYTLFCFFTIYPTHMHTYDIGSNFPYFPLRMCDGYPHMHIWSKLGLHPIQNFTRLL